MIKTAPRIVAVIEKYRKLIYAICYGVLNDAHLSEDVTQDVFERLIKHADTIISLDEPKQIAYISVVARNRAIDVSKKERTQISVVEKIKQNTSMAMDVRLNTTFIDDYGFSFEIRELILRLDDLERDIIVMKYGLGYTYRDIAELLERKERYIYYKARTAHDKLYKAILEGGVTGVR